jgi:hypothetical protein
MIEIKINDKEVTKLFNELVRRGQNMSPAMKIISGIMLDAVRENFGKDTGLEKYSGYEDSYPHQSQTNMTVKARVSAPIRYMRLFINLEEIYSNQGKSFISKSIKRASMPEKHYSPRAARLILE